MKKFFIAAGIIIVSGLVVVIALRIFSSEDDWICQDGQWVKHGSPKAEKPAGSCGKMIGNNIDQSVEQLKPAAEEANIVVFNPKEDAKISSPFDLEGKARVFENVVGVRLKGKSGTILFQGTTDAQSPDTGKFGLFQEEIRYDTSETEGTLEIFESSAKDGSEVNKITISVEFLNENNPAETDGN